MDDEYLFDDIEFLETTTSSRQVKQSNKKRNFSVREKKKLANLVQKHSLIWNVQHKLHCNHAAVSAAWQSIADEMKEPVDHCKYMWKSLRDSLRYHQAKVKSKSGSSLDVVDQIEDTPINEDVEWEFADSLSYLVPISSKRRTFTTSTRCDESATVNMESAGGSEDASSSNYFYQTPSKKKKDGLEESAKSLSASIAELVNIRKQGENHSIKNFVMLSNLDRMLQHLPDDVVEDPNKKFIDLAYEEIRKQRNNL